MGEGKDARVAGAAVTYAAIRYRNAAKAARKRGEIPLRDEVARARAGVLLSAAAAWHPLWLKWRVSLGEPPRPDSPIPPAQTRPGEVFQASKRFLGFALHQGHHSPHLGRRDPEGGGATAPGCPDPCYSQFPHSAAGQPAHTALKAHRLREAATAPDRE